MLVQLPRTPIELRISDKIADETKIAQMARYLGHNIEYGQEGECRVTVKVRVTMHAMLADGAIGAPLTGAGFANRIVVLTADNNCVVDAQTGEILAIRQLQLSDDWQAVVDSFGDRPIALQGDVFWAMMEQPVVSGDMIRQHIQQADAMARFA